MRLYFYLSISLIFSLTLIQGKELYSADPVKFVPTDFQLYYGSDPKLLNNLQLQLQKGQVVAVDLRGLDQGQISDLIKRAHQVGAKIIAYISIGELGQLEKDKFDKYLHKRKSATTLAEMTLGKNEIFQSWHIDVNQPAWQEFQFHRINEIYKQKVDGLFLDTVDTIDLYINHQKWSFPRRAKSVSAMINLIRQIKAHSPGKFIMQNRGLNLIEKSVFVGDATGVLVPGLNLKKSHPHNPDGLLWESAYAHHGEWIEAKEREMIQIQKNGNTTVFTLGYADTKANRRQFFAKSQAAGFIPAWASSTKNLHQELTQGNADE